MVVCPFVLVCCAPSAQEPQAPAVAASDRQQSAQKVVDSVPAGGGTTLEAIVGRGELRVGMQVGYVPFQMLGNDGTLVGLDMDLASMVARSLRVNLRIVRQTWQELIPSLLEGKTDVVMSGMSVTPERNLQVAFTIPLVETGRMFLVHRSNERAFQNIQDLDKNGIFVVSAPGGLGELRIRDSMPNVSHREFPDRKLALAEVLEKRAQAFIDEEFSIRLACAGQAETFASPFKPLTFEPIAWAVRPGDCHWLNWLDNFIRKINGDGRLDNLKKKWFQDYFLDMRPHR